MRKRTTVRFFSFSWEMNAGLELGSWRKRSAGDGKKNLRQMRMNESWWQTVKIRGRVAAEKSTDKADERRRRRFFSVFFFNFYFFFVTKIADIFE
jgi:hypothetical protein